MIYYKQEKIKICLEVSNFREAMVYFSLEKNKNALRFMTFLHENKGIPMSYEDVLSIEIKRTLGDKLWR